MEEEKRTPTPPTLLPQTPEMLAHGASKDKTTYRETLINFLKGNIGAGWLSLAFAEAKIGYVGGSIGIFLLAYLSVHCMHLLLELKNDLHTKGGSSQMSYTDIARATLGKVGDYIVNTALVVTQLGFCTIYILFVSDHLNELITKFQPWEYTLMILPFVAALIFIRSFRIIAYTSAVSNLLILFGFCTILIFNFMHLGKHVQVDPSCHNHPASNVTVNGTTAAPYPSCLIAPPAVPWAGFGQLPIFFGNCIFAYEAIGLILPMENSMKEPQYMGSVINWGMLLIAWLYFIIALSGYLVFGDSVAGSITLNLPSDGLFNSVKVALCFALYQSISVQFVPAIQIIERFIDPRINKMTPSPTMRYALNGVVRVTIITGCAGLAIGIPKLGLFISLIGSVGSGLLALILPPLMHVIYLWQTCPTWVKVKDILLIAFGLLGSVTGTYVAIQQIAESF